MGNDYYYVHNLLGSLATVKVKVLQKLSKTMEQTAELIEV